MPLNSFLQRSRVTVPFRTGVLDFIRTGRANEAVRFDGWSPPVKVERTLCKILEQYPELPLASVQIEGVSGCESFVGTATLATDEGSERRIRFHWDCRWKAEQLGWTDYFGFPDQARAAREFGYDCFRTWEEEPEVATIGA